MLFLHSERGKHVTCQKTDRRITRDLRATGRNKRCQSGSSSASPAQHRPLLTRTALASGVLFPVAPSRGAIRRMYGKDNRILYSAKVLQGCKVGAAKRTRQAVGL